MITRFRTSLILTRTQSSNELNELDIIYSKVICFLFLSFTFTAFPFSLTRKCMVWPKLVSNFSFIFYVFQVSCYSFCNIVVGIRRRQEEYHPQLERSEFYSMENLSKQAVLFNPIPEYDENSTKMLGLDIETGNAIIT